MAGLLAVTFLCCSDSLFVDAALTCWGLRLFWRAGQTASLLSKYRPPQPILTLVIPTLKNDGFKWQLVGRGVARQCQIQRGLLPVLAAPSPSGAHQHANLPLQNSLVPL